MLDIGGNGTGLSTRGDEVFLGLDLCSGKKRTISMMSTIYQGIERMQVAGYQMSPAPETPHKMPNCNVHSPYESQLLSCTCIHRDN